MDLEAELDRLYQLLLGEFIAERNELAKRLHQEGDRQAAGRIKSLIKPALTAWVVNQLHFRAKPELDSLMAAGDRVREAHLAGADAHREAMTARREAISRLLATAADILAEGGQTMSCVHRQRISRTLETLASGSTEEPAGRLSRDLEPAGFDVLSGLAAALAQTPKAAPTPAASKPAARKSTPALRLVKGAGAPEEPTAEEADADLERRLMEAREALAETESRAAELESQAADAGARRDEAERAQSEAEAEVKEAERRVRQVRERARAADAAAKEARQGAVDAEKAAARARVELAAARSRVEGIEREKEATQER